MKKKLLLYLAVLIFMSGCKKAVETADPMQELPDSSYEAGPGVTGAIILSPEDYKGIPFYKVSPGKNGGRMLEQINSAEDLSLEMPPPDNQGPELSCVGWTVSYAIRSYLYHKEKKTSYWSGIYVRNNNSVFSPRFAYNLIRQKGNVDRGARLTDGIKLLQETGVCTWNSSPYEFGKYLIPVTEKQLEEAGNYKVFTGQIASNILEIKKYISIIKNPVAVSLQIDEGFQEPNKNIRKGYEVIEIDGKKEICWKTHGKLLTDFHHAMTVVGYNDEKRVVKVMNSFGDGWANKGFIWIDYDLFSLILRNAFVAGNSLSDLELVDEDSSNESVTGKIEVSYRCKGRSILTGQVSINYHMKISTNSKYASDLEKFLYLITPDGKSYYKLKLKENNPDPDPDADAGNNDGKTFYATFSFSPYYVYYYNSILYEGGGYDEVYDMNGFLTANESLSTIKSNFYTPHGLYKYVVAINTNGKLISSEIKQFPKPLFTIETFPCIGEISYGPNLFTVDI